MAPAGQNCTHTLQPSHFKRINRDIPSGGLETAPKRHISAQSPQAVQAWASMTASWPE